MDIWVVNERYELKDVIDRYEDLIWAERFRTAGDFELHMPASTFAELDLALGAYLQIPDSDVTMIVETIDRKTDIEDGDHVTITGRSLESLLARRVAWGQVTLDGLIDDELKMLIEDNVGHPGNQDREIPDFYYEKNTGDPIISETRIERQYFCDNIYDIVAGICEEYDIGFKVGARSGGGFVMSLYAGADRSYDQDDRPYVIFSPAFDNLINSDLYHSSQSTKNVALVAGEGEGNDRELVEVGAETGINRQEMFVDASDLSQTVRDGQGQSQTLTPEAYRAILRERGQEELAPHLEDELLISAEVDPTRQFVYGRDFFMGDIVQVEDAYGVGSHYRMVELVRSYGVNGSTAVPTFAVVADQGN